MTKTEVVGLLKAVVDGGLAIGKLQCGKDDPAKKLIDAVRVTSEGKTLTVLWSSPASDVWKLVEKYANRKAEKRAKMGKSGPTSEEEF